MLTDHYSEQFLYNIFEDNEIATKQFLVNINKSYSLKKLNLKALILTY